MPQKLMHTPNESKELITMSIKSEKPCSSKTIACIHLGGVNWHADDPNGPGNQTDWSHGQADKPRGSVDALNMSYNTETAMLGHRDSGGTYLRPGDTKHHVRETDGVGSHADMLTWLMDITSIETNVLIPKITPDTISTHPTEAKLPGIPDSTANQTLNKSGSLRGHADRSSTCTHAQSIAHETETAANMSENIRMHQNRSKTQDSPTQSAKQLPDEPNSCRYHLDGSDGWTDMQNSGNEMETPADEAETINMHLIESKLLKLLTMGANSCANETDRSHMITPADKAGNIRTHQNKQKWPNSPAGSATLHSEDPNAFRNHTDMLGTCTNGHSITNDTKPAENALKNIRKHQMDSKTQTHYMCLKLGHPSPPINGERSAQIVLMYTYH